MKALRLFLKTSYAIFLVIAEVLAIFFVTLASVFRFCKSIKAWVVGDTAKTFGEVFRKDCHVVRWWFWKRHFGWALADIKECLAALNP